MLWKIKNWLLRLTEPWREEQAALDLEWKVFARKYNAAGKRPECWYPGMEEDGRELDPMGKVVLVDAREVSPNYLRDQHDYRHVDRESDVYKKVTAVEKAQNLRFSNRKGVVEKDDE